MDFGFAGGRSSGFLPPVLRARSVLCRNQVGPLAFRCPVPRLDSQNPRPRLFFWGDTYVLNRKKSSVFLCRGPQGRFRYDERVPNAPSRHRSYCVVGCLAVCTRLVGTNRSSPDSSAPGDPTFQRTGSATNNTSTWKPSTAVISGWHRVPERSRAVSRFSTSPEPSSCRQA